jgi:hypothetical protein
MKLRRQLYQPLPIYETLEESYYKNKCASCHSSVIYDKNHLPAFIIERENNFFNRFFDITLVNKDTGAEITDIETGLSPTIVTYTDEEGNLTDQCLFKEIEVDSLPCGYYRLKITDNDKTWYSEIYKIVDIDTAVLSHNKLQWRNDCYLNDIMYPDAPDFYFGTYLEDITKICEPDYEFELTVQKNNLGKERPKFQSMKKTYRLDTGLIPEYLVDAFNFMRIHETIKIFPIGEDASVYDYSVENFNTSNPSWTDNGCETNIEFRFVRDSSIIKTGCCTVDKVACPDTSKIIINLNNAVCFLEDPGTLEVGDSFYVNQSCPPEQYSSNVPCISITEGNMHLNKIWTWNGTCFDFSDPVEYATAIINQNTNETATVYFGGSSYVRVPNISIVSLNAVSINLFVTFIPFGFYAIVSESTDNGASWEFAGEHTKDEIENGITLFGTGSYLYRVEVLNFNCNLGTQIVSYVYP